MIEGWSWADSFYMVFITLSTVGFSEVHTLSAGGRLWTVLLIVGGVGAMGYLVARLFEAIMEGSLHGLRRQRRMQKHIESVVGHTIICGFGRVGRQVVRDFVQNGSDIVVVDAADTSEELKRLSIPHIIGRAEDEEVLLAAGIERAAVLVSAVDSDTVNVFITLTARQLNPKLRIIARASDSDTAKKLQLVGAERVVSPFVASGRRMAHLALRPQAVEFFDVLSDPVQGLRVEMLEIEIGPESKLAGRTLRDVDLRRSTGTIAVALRSEGSIHVNPDPDARMEVGARLVAMGTAEQCAKLEALNQPDAPVSS
jgi:voltage-gated potassium channel